MEAVAKLKYVRVSPRKIKVILDMIRGKNTEEALAILKNVPRMACGCLEKLLRSAIANAENNCGMNPEILYVSSCFVTPGPTLKRHRAVSKGRSHRILKGLSHVVVQLKEYGENREEN